METYSEEEMVQFAKFAKNYTSPKDVEKAFLDWRISRDVGYDTVTCQTGDQWIRVKEDGSWNAVYEMAWQYRPSGRKGVRGKYFPSAYNIITHYMRTPMKSAKPYDEMVKNWTIFMVIQALRYIPKDKDKDWKDTIYKVIKWENGLPIWDIGSGFPGQLFFITHE